MMKQPVTFLFILLVAAALAEQDGVERQQQVKKGCGLYGHACYGGHGKRSASTTDQLHAPDSISQLLHNDDRFYGQYPRYRLAKILRQLMDARPMEIPAERINNNDIEYAASSYEI